MLKAKSQLLIGTSGLNMVSDAIEFCKSYLKKDNPETHPDYLFVCPANGKKSMGVDEARLIENKASLRPSIAAHQVIIIDGIDLMTEAGQNKLLKTLEDKDAIIFCISYGGRVLDTVRSRMETVYYRPLDKPDFMKETGLSGREGNLLFYASSGCPSTAMLLTSYLARFEQIVAAIEKDELPKLLPAMSILKEKDKESVAESSDKIYFINLILAAFIDQLSYNMTGKLPDNPLTTGCNSYSTERLLNIIGLLLENRRICQQSGYSKNNFFQLIAGIIESK